MTTDTESYYDDAIEVHHPDCRPRIIRAPQKTAMTLSLLLAADPKLVEMSGPDELSFPNANYRVVGWDSFKCCLLLERTYADDDLIEASDVAKEGDL